MTRTTLALACLLGPQAMGQTLYALDDGAGTFNIGPSQFDAIMGWGNVFEVAGADNLITEARISFAGSLPEGQPLTIVVFDDPTDDDDPTDALPVSTTEVLTADTGIDEFGVYALDPALVSGAFFVCAFFDAPQGQSVARMDEDTLGTHSWLFFDERLNLDLETQPYILRMSDSPFSGTWMIRAIGERCLADFNADAGLDILDFVAFQGAFLAGDEEADANGDGRLDILDFVAFQSAFVAGCS